MIKKIQITRFWKNNISSIFLLFLLTLLLIELQKVPYINLIFTEPISMLLGTITFLYLFKLKSQTTSVIAACGLIIVGIETILVVPHMAQIFGIYTFYLFCIAFFQMLWEIYHEKK
jgi:hypothetical protein